MKGSRRRRRRTIIIAAVVLAAWAAIAFRGTPQPAADAAPPQHATPPEPEPDRESTPPAAPGDTAARDPAPPDPAPHPDAALLDRLGGGIYTLDQALSEGRLGAACTAWDEVAILDLEAFHTLTAQRAAARVRLDAALSSWIGEIAEMIRTGRVLTARGRVHAARTPRNERTERALLELATEASWPAWPPDGAATTNPLTPRPLAADRLVRVPAGDTWLLGRVTRSTSRPGLDDELTVRIDSAKGTMFRFVPRHAVEPVAATADEAIDQAIAALRAGEAELAALWLAYAAARRPGPDPRIDTVARTLTGSLRAAVPPATATRR